MSRRRRSLEIQRAREDATSLGNVLLQMGAIAEVDLRAALKLQQDRDRMLGRLLVLARIISEEDLKAALETQADLRHGKPTRRTRGVVRIATRRTLQVEKIGDRVAHLGANVVQQARTGSGFPAVCGVAVLDDS